MQPPLHESAVFPNPFESIVNIDSVGTGNYELTNIMGISIMSLELTQKSTPIDLSFLPDGAYFLRIPGEKIIVKKLVKTKGKD